MIFCISKFQKNKRICGFHLAFKSKKCFSFRGLPLTLRPRALPLDPRWGLRPQTPVIGSRSARSPWLPSLPNLNYATACRPMYNYKNAIKLLQNITKYCEFVIVSDTETIGKIKMKRLLTRSKTLIGLRCSHSSQRSSLSSFVNGFVDKAMISEDKHFFGINIDNSDL